jgi:hypothetical protein
MLTDAVIGAGGGVGRGVGAGVGRGVETNGCGVGAGVAWGVGEAVADGVGLPTATGVAEADSVGGADWPVDRSPQAVSKHATTIANVCRSMSSSVEKFVGG